MNLSGEEERGSYESCLTEALQVMKAKLPEYVVNCFVASGYDTLSVISEMDVSSDPGNSIQLIEEYINENHSDDPNCKHIRSSSKAFKFPPGHRLAIKSFISEIKRSEQQKCRSMKKEGRDSQHGPKRIKLSSNVTKSQSDLTDPAKLLSGIRRQLAKWQQMQKQQSLRDLKEHENFKIHVNSKEDGILISSIQCLNCGKSYSLGKKDGQFIISNWTKHVAGKCVPSDKRLNQNLRQYLNPTEKATKSISLERTCSVKSYETDTTMLLDRQNIDLQTATLASCKSPVLVSTACIDPSVEVSAHNDSPVTVPNADSNLFVKISSPSRDCPSLVSTACNDLPEGYFVDETSTVVQDLGRMESNKEYNDHKIECTSPENQVFRHSPPS